MVIDSHAHLDMDDFRDDIDLVISRASQSGVNRIITVGIDSESSVRALNIARKYDFIYSTIGYHPHNSGEVNKESLDRLKSLASEPEVVAWGEIGLDFFRNKSSRETQMEAFACQLDLALESGLPVIIHNREADRDVFDLLKPVSNKGLRGVIHCFSGDYDMAVKFMDLGFYISIPGVVTFKNAATLREVAAGIPLDRMLVETDSPYLAPEPFRGKRNEPSYVVHTARKIAQIRDIDFEELALRTSENTQQLFRII